MHPAARHWPEVPRVPSGALARELPLSLAADGEQHPPFHLTRRSSACSSSRAGAAPSAGTRSSEKWQLAHLTGSGASAILPLGMPSQTAAETTGLTVST